jgi:DNA-binding transcriptional LysR family regulator
MEAPCCAALRDATTEMADNGRPDMKDFDGMKLNQLKMLVAVAEHGSFSAAAAELGCTQSRISHGLAELEGELGVSLLARGRAGSTPTEAGQRVLEKARQMLRLEDSLRAAAAATEGLSGTVRIACFRSVGTHLLPHVLEALAQRHPQLRVEIDDSCEQRADVTSALQDGLAEIGIAQLPLAGALASRPTCTTTTYWSSLPRWRWRAVPDPAGPSSAPCPSSAWPAAVRWRSWRTAVRPVSRPRPAAP